jgi:beta-lactamase regulating signal transducer with metallopeptidase domain
MRWPVEQYVTVDVVWAIAILVGLLVVVAAVQLTLQTRARASTQRENDDLREQISSLRDHRESAMGEVRGAPPA